MSALAEEVGRLILASTAGAVGLVAFRDKTLERYLFDPLRYVRPWRRITATAKVAGVLGETRRVEFECPPDWGAQPIAGWILRETRGGWAR